MVRRVLVSGVLSVVSASCWSLSLGQFSGQAVMGQALNISIPVGLSSDETASELCPLVRVYFAEDVLPSNQVKVVVRPGGANDSAVLWVSTLTALTEPYARMDVVAGCANQHSRQYTILADLPMLETPRAAKVAPVVSLPVSQAPLQRAPETLTRSTVPTPAKVNGLTNPDKPVARKTVRPINEPEQPLVSRAEQAPSRKTAETPAVQGARLKLDPLELVASLAQLSPALKMASDGIDASESDAGPELEQRRAAARALWRALNEAPDQVASNTVKAEATGQENQNLKAQLAAARQSVVDVQGALETERDGIYAHPVVLALGGGLLVALGGLAILLTRRKTSPHDKRPWWNAKVAAPVVVEKPVKSKVKAKSALAVVAEMFENWKRNRKRQSEVDTFFPSDSLFKGGVVRRDVRPRQSDQGPSTLGGSEFSASALMNGSRSVATEELFDLQQQVEFFISLGQADQAVDVLVNHLSENQEPSPLAYLDLLRLYHELSRRDEYEALRKEFNRLFSGSAPAFDNYSQSRRGLERYETTLSKIQSLWPTPAVLDWIESSIFRQSSGEEQEVFDLEAYRELLLLYGIARDIITPDSLMGAMGTPSSFGFLGDQSPLSGPALDAIRPQGTQTRDTVRGDVGGAPHTPVQHVDTVIEHRIPEVSFDEVDIDLDLSLDLDLSEDGLKALDVPLAPLASPSALEEPMSFDLSDSLFDALPEPGESGKALQPASAKPAFSQVEAGASLDFSSLDDIETFTIKKSGSKS